MLLLVYNMYITLLGFQITSVHVIHIRLYYILLHKSESESECKCLTCNQKPTKSQFSLLHEPN